MFYLKIRRLCLELHNLRIKSRKVVTFSCYEVYAAMRVSKQVPTLYERLIGAILTTLTS